MKFTPLYHVHRKKDAIMTHFAGYELPLYYSSIIEEHLAVREGSGIFDVSHMGRIVVEGNNSTEFMELILPTSVRNKHEMKAFYNFILNDRGFIIDDLMVFKISNIKYILVVNAINRKKVFNHITKLSGNFGVEVTDITDQTCMFAVQGPASPKVIQEALPSFTLPTNRYEISINKVEEKKVIVSRTGYTGEDGFELIIPSESGTTLAELIWEKVSALSKECGLGARDTLRIEAGLPLYGNEIDEETSPYELGFERLISFEKEFIGKNALIKTKLPSKIIRGIIADHGIPRSGASILNVDKAIGTISSGTFSPILKKGIGLGKVSMSCSEPGTKVIVALRAFQIPAEIVKPPFYDTQKYGFKRSVRL